MWKNWLIFILGILLILVPFFGFPLSFARATYVILGIIIAVCSFLAARDLHIITVHLNSLPSTEAKNDNFVDTSTDEIVEDGQVHVTSGEKLV